MDRGSEGVMALPLAGARKDESESANASGAPGRDLAAPAAALDFESLVRGNQRLVFSIAYRYLRDSGAAEEVAQDVFFELHKRLHTVESPQHAAHWLRRVACHRSIDYARRHAAELRLRVRPAGNQEENFAQPAAAGWPPDPWAAKRLEALVAELPPKVRMVVILRFQHDAKLEEIAEALRMPLNTVKSHLHRALAAMRERIQAMENKKWK